MKYSSLPTFLFIGSPKCGSTWIFRALRAHPQVFVPLAKDLHYFDAYYYKGLDWYASFFTSVNGKVRAMGELSHNYLYSREAAERIAADLPKVKLFVSVRNPIDRAFSGYLYRKRNGASGADFDEVLKLFPEILERGSYFKYLSIYRELFDESDIKVFFFDDLRQDPFRFAKSIYEYVGVDPGFDYLDADKKVLPASEARMGWVSTAMKKVARRLRHQGYANLIGSVKDSFVPKVLFKPIGKQTVELLEIEHKKRLIDYYAEDVMSLQQLTGRDLSHWLR